MIIVCTVAFSMTESQVLSLVELEVGKLRKSKLLVPKAALQLVL